MERSYSISSDKRAQCHVLYSGESIFFSDNYMDVILEGYDKG